MAGFQQTVGRYTYVDCRTNSTSFIKEHNRSVRSNKGLVSRTSKLCSNGRILGASQNSLARGKHACSTQNWKFSVKAKAESEPDSEGKGWSPMSWLKNTVQQMNEWADDLPMSPGLQYATSQEAPLWSLTLSLYERDPVKGPLTPKKAAGLPRVDLSATCRFQPPDAGTYPPRGGADVEDSRYFSGGPGAFWISGEDEGDFFKFTLNTEEVKAGSTLILPEGRVFFNARLKESTVPGTPYRMQDGVVTVKQDVKASFLGQDYSGILAEYIVVGTFSAKPKEASSAA